MLFDPENSQHLKPWLVRTLEPICDAEPGALADYVLALLKHDGQESDLRKEVKGQLDEFLEKECQPFIDTLFTVLRTKSYLPYTSSASGPSSDKSLDPGGPLPLDVSHSTSRRRKRSIDGDNHDGRPAKEPRVSQEGPISRYESGRSGGLESSGDWAWAGMQGGGYPSHLAQVQGMMNGMNGRKNPAYQPPDHKRGICRDYHNKGYCARGNYCKFSHGEDAITPNQLFAMNGQAMPFMQMFDPFAMQGNQMGYDPRDSGMNGRHQPQRPPVTSRQQEEDGNQVQHTPLPGELPVIQDLTPNVPLSDVQPHLPPPASTPSEYITYNTGPLRPPDHAPPIDVAMLPPPSVHSRPPPSGPRRGRPPTGTFTGDAPNFRPERLERPERKKDKTLVIEKIPEDKLNINQLSDWFKRFGNVTNVAIDSRGSKALVSFSTHEEAHAAWKAEEAVFGNRFVKVFWHRPMEGHGSTGAKLLAASAPILANIAAKDAAPEPSNVPPTPRKPSVADALASKQKLLEDQIAEQKSLMASLDTASAEEKKSIMARLRKLGEEMKPTSVPPPAAPAAAEQKALDKLDQELDLHNSASGEEQPETTESLKAKLERLKAEAASLGIPDVTMADPPSYRGRGRGRGRGYFRGTPMRGGPPRASMKLDNRPKKLLVKGGSSVDPQAVHDYYDSSGQVESVVADDNAGVIVSFKTRGAAEQGLAQGSTIPVLGPVQVSWYTQQSSTGSTPKPAPKEASTPSREARDTTPPTEISRHEEEEIVSHGWGDAEDGMGLL